MTAGTVQVGLKVYYALGDIKCLARGASTEAIVLSDGIATVDLRACVVAVTNSSPELLGNRGFDYSIYTIDCTEETELFVGQGLLSWSLTQEDANKRVSGLIKGSLSGQILEVKMKLSKVTSSSQVEFLDNMETYEKIAKGLPKSFDRSSWSEFMRHAKTQLVTQANTSDIFSRKKGLADLPVAVPTHRRTGSSSGYASRERDSSPEGPLPDPLSPLLPMPIPSSPLMMTTMALPPISMRSNSLPCHPASEPNMHPHSQPRLPTLARFQTAPNANVPAKPKRRRNNPMRSAPFPPEGLNRANIKSHVAKTQQIFKGTAGNGSIVEQLQKLREEAAKARAMTVEERAERDVLQALQEGRPPKYCYNCGTIKTRGNWRCIHIDSVRQLLCNACGVYYKNHTTMRPESLWEAATKSKRKADDADLAIVQPETKKRTVAACRQTQSSPVMKSLQPSPRSFVAIRATAASVSSNFVVHRDRQVMAELPIPLNIPQSPVAHIANMDDLVSLLTTPKKQIGGLFRSHSSPSPWKSAMFAISEESPGRKTLDRFLEDMGMTDNMGSLLGSSPPGLTMFTSDHDPLSNQDENMTPSERLYDGDLFTPKKGNFDDVFGGALMC